MIVKNKEYSQYKGEDIITCVLITYKQSKYIYDCIDSVLNQEKAHIQLIITDDGTPDYSSEEVENYVDSCRGDSLVSAVFIHHKENVGTVRNINGAIKMAVGNYIKIIGGDDSYPTKDVFFCQRKCLEDDKRKLVVVGKIQDTDENLKPILNERIDKGNELLAHIFEMDYVEARKIMNRNNLFPIANQASCFRKEFFERYGLCDERYRVVEDAELALRVLEHKDEAVFINKTCVNHRQKGGISTSKTMFEPRRLAYYHDFVIFSKLQSKEHPEVFSLISRIEIPRVNLFVYKMAKAKADNKGLVAKIVIALSFFDTILYYALSKPKRLVKRIVERFR